MAPSLNTEYLPLVITSIKEEIAGVKTFTVAADNGAVIPYQAGQFLTFVFTHHLKEERRSYSISSSPDRAEPLSFTVRRLDNGAYSRLLTDRAEVGSLLYTTGAAGLFTVPNDIGRYEQVFFFAAGIGITPVYSLIKTLLHTRPALRIVLVYSNRRREDVVFYDVLMDLMVMSDGRLRIELLYSTAFNLSRARLNKTLIPVLLQEYGVTTKDKMLFYLCGPFDYMRMAIFTLEELHIKDEQIKRENFDTNMRPARKALPPDKETRKVTLSMAGIELSFPVHYPESILQAAKKAGIALAYSCETGRCGSCAALCTHGSVWLSYNEVLMSNDIAEGKTLTCTGHPVGGDVRLEI